MSNPVSRTVVRHALCALALVVAALPSLAATTLPAREPQFEPALPAEGWPSDQVTVDFGRFLGRIAGCSVAWAGAKDEAQKCDLETRTATITVPAGTPAGPTTLLWELDYSPEPVVGRRAAPPQPSETVMSPSAFRTGGELPFTVLGVVATADRTRATPGESIGVTFQPVGDSVRITDCGLIAPTAASCPPEGAESRLIKIIVPTDRTPGRELELEWSATSRSPDDPRRHVNRGTLKVAIVALPEPEFDVRGQATTLRPGEQYVATFQSLTPGISISNCGLTLDGYSACGATDVAVVRVPYDTRPGTTLTIPWTLEYASKRPAEPRDTAHGTLLLRVTDEQSRMQVTVQPASARPDEEVVLTFVTTRPRVLIAGCEVFFPGQIPGAFCQKSPMRWFARARVPADARPGPTLLRWGVESRTGADLVADTGSFLFTVRPRLRNTPKKPSLPKIDPRQPTRPIDPTTDPTVAATAEPAFTATTGPESAPPGERVTVSIATLSPGVRLTGCSAGFRGRSATPCRLTGQAFGSAGVTVPATAEAGDHALGWAVTWRDTSGRTGRHEETIAYRVSDPGTPAPPQFLAEVAPPKAKPGERVTIAPAPVDDGVTITGCHAEFGAGGGPATDCRETPQGWMADVTVPEDAPGGTGAVLWKVAYEGTGRGTADGFSRLEVVPVADAGFWSKVASFGGRIALGFAALAGFVAYRSFAGRIRERFKQGRTDLPAGAHVVLAKGSDAFRTELAAPAREPRPAIRLIPDPGRPRFTLREESS
ncbi:hypothetical protein OWR29_24045 [Actinoplanes sp. Pm04-4]|uniref:Uncharacterized protein n=1 Tax=Paractinoplanes pyxinae TaxID=2997416 RepID=A0ABT4B3K7_9ACTN|nr:hypothetical protein [Actinoplanes pyxinae]MCY1141082.1 hypothetical protein [Actinoplanes pyxinae]